RLTPVPDWSGEELLTIEVSDGEYQAQTCLSIKVIPVNDAPCDVEIIVTTDLTEGSEHIFKGIATDVDVPYGDSLIFIWFIDGKMTGVGDTVEVSLDASQHEIGLVVRDQKGASNMTTTKISVEKVNEQENDHDLWQLLIPSLALIVAIVHVIVKKGRDRMRGKI
ncbi:MAG: hypothetical protein JW939_02435, partial [Candidatus Thermoplasmatota archaeon]|nr:hypothetical protein [Candidatus Thermoplasmatota archaeon]